MNTVAFNQKIAPRVDGVVAKHMGPINDQMAAIHAAIQKMSNNNENKKRKRDDKNENKDKKPKAADNKLVSAAGNKLANAVDTLLDTKTLLDMKRGEKKKGLTKNGNPRHSLVTIMSNADNRSGGIPNMAKRVRVCQTKSNFPVGSRVHKAAMRVWRAMNSKKRRPLLEELWKRAAKEHGYGAADDSDSDDSDSDSDDSSDDSEDSE